MHEHKAQWWVICQEPRTTQGGASPTPAWKRDDIGMEHGPGSRGWVCSSMLGCTPTPGYTTGDTFPSQAAHMLHHPRLLPSLGSPSNLSCNPKQSCVGRGGGAGGVPQLRGLFWCHGGVLPTRIMPWTQLAPKRGTSPSTLALGTHGEKAIGALATRPPSAFPTSCTLGLMAFPGPPHQGAPIPGGSKSRATSSGRREQVGHQVQQHPSHSTCMGDRGRAEMVARSNQESRANQKSRSSNTVVMRWVQCEARKTSHRPGPAMARQVHDDGSR